jgi:hypothetical protein
MYQGVCPHCGYCPYCGRRNYPYYQPYQPYWYWASSNPATVNMGGLQGANDPQMQCNHSDVNAQSD